MNAEFALNALLAIAVGFIGLAVVVGIGHGVVWIVTWIMGEEDAWS